MKLDSWVRISRGELAKGLPTPGDRLAGLVFGNPLFEDEQFITTSPITEVHSSAGVLVKIVTLTGSTYIAGKCILDE